MSEVMEFLKVGGIILGAGYFIWKIEAQAKANKALIDRMDEKHSLFLENVKNLYDKEIATINEKLNNKRSKIEEIERNINIKYAEMKKEIEAMKEHCNNNHSSCQMKMANFLEERKADEKYVSKIELQLELQKIDNKLDTLISYFRGKDGDGLPKVGK